MRFRNTSWREPDAPLYLRGPVFQE